MRPFMGEDFLLYNQPARRLYQEFARSMPIFDYHCHLPIEEIADNKRFKNITEIWLDGDHYKWRLMRANGVDEAYITGDKSDKEKFLKWAETVPKTIGNPIYHWTHMELKTYFDSEQLLSEKTAEQIWEMCNEQLQTSEFTTQSLIKRSNVAALCTTDNPIDDLVGHKRIKEDPSVDFEVLPAFRPDEAINLDQASFTSWIQALEEVSGRSIKTYEVFLEALEVRVDYFHQTGCRLSDHSLEGNFYQKSTPAQIQTIFNNRLSGQLPNQEELAQFKSATLIELGKMYRKHNWVMQLHIGAMRNNNTRKWHTIGINAGFDSMSDDAIIRDLCQLLDGLDQENALPKTILYCLNPKDNYAVASLIGSFQEQVPGKLQFGTAWWFNDHIDGMTSQIKTLANVGLLSQFVGMLTDSRSFLSYPRHDYFRRLLCNLIGEWVENGQAPKDYELLGKLVQDICYNNSKTYIS